MVMDNALKDEVISILAKRIASLELAKAVLVAKARRKNREWGDGDCSLIFV